LSVDLRIESRIVVRLVNQQSLAVFKNMACDAGPGWQANFAPAQPFGNQRPKLVLCGIVKEQRRPLGIDDPGRYRHNPFQQRLEVTFAGNR
jgi:hypothetical protein